MLDLNVGYFDLHNEYCLGDYATTSRHHKEEFYTLVSMLKYKIIRHSEE